MKTENLKVKDIDSSSKYFSLSCPAVTTLRRIPSPFSISFSYDGWNLISETCTGEPMCSTLYTWGLDLSGSMQGAGGVGGLLSTVQDGDIYFSCFDANGNITDYVDDTGDIVAHYEYNPFGGITSATGEKKDDFNFRFSTKYLDTETDLYYYGYRYYTPPLGRFVNQDPIGGIGSFVRRVFLSELANLYSMIGNDLLNSFDLLGLYEPDYTDSRNYTDIRKANDCKDCKASDVNKEGCKAGKEAYKLTVNDEPPLKGIPILNRPEYCGRVCCNKKTHETKHTKPIKTHNWKHELDRNGDGSYGYVYGLGKMKCDPKDAPKCSTFGKDWGNAGYYHSHPKSPDFSPGDWEWTCGKKYPFFVVNGDSCRMLDPWVGDFNDGTITWPNAPYGVIEYVVDPVTGLLKVEEKRKTHNIKKDKDKD